MTSPPEPPRPPELLATVWLARKPGSKPVDVLVDEAAAQQAIDDLSAALCAIRAGQRAIRELLVPQVTTPYPAPAAASAAIAAGQSVIIPDDVTPESDEDHAAALANAYFLPERAAGLLAMAPALLLPGPGLGLVAHCAQVLFRDGSVVVDREDSLEISGPLAANTARLLRTWDVDWTGDDPHVTNEVRFAGEPQPVPDAADVLLTGAATDVAVRAPGRPMCPSVLRLPGTSTPLACILNGGHDGTHVTSAGRHNWTGDGEAAIEVCASAGPAGLSCTLPPGHEDDHKDGGVSPLVDSRWSYEVAAAASL